jgi:hypothetical protein
MKRFLLFLAAIFFLSGSGFSQDNILLNGGFENWTGSFPDDWSVNTSFVKDSLTVHSGNYSLRMEGPASSNRYAQQEVDVTPGVTYTFRSYVFDNDPNVSVRVWHRFRDSGGTILSTISSDYTNDDPNWQFIEVQGEAPPTSVLVQFEVRAYNGGGIGGGFAYLDDCELIAPTVNAPVITNVSYEPFPANQPIDITGDVTVPTGTIDSVALYYYTDFNLTSVDSMPMSLGSGDQYTASLPGFSNGTGLAYWVKAWGNNTSSLSAQNKVIIGIPDIGIFHSDLDADGLPLADGYLTKLRGIVTVASGVFSTSNYDFYMQDNTGGINVFEFNIGATQYNEGDSLEVSGTIDTYNGKVELSNFDATVLSTDNPLPAPIDISIEDMGEAYEGRLISIANVTLSAGTWLLTPPDTSYNLTITDGTGDLIMRIVGSTDIGGNPEPVWPVTVVGIGNQFDTSAPYFEGFQIQPRSYSDFATTGIDDNPAVVYSYSLGQNYPNPFNPETIIPYTLQKAGKVNLRVFNILGQVVYSFSQKQSAGEHTLTFDGRRFSSGIYFYQLQAGNFRSVRKMILTK